MCTNYRPAARDVLAQMFEGFEGYGTGSQPLQFPAPAFDYPEEAWPGYSAPIARRSDRGRLEPVRAAFGLVPRWAKDSTFGRRTYNARSETVGEKPAFREAWRGCQRCLVPMARFFEPDWSSGKAIRWRIERTDQAPFIVAGLWEHWIERTTGHPMESFTLLTINADGHPVMGRFHRPGDEKRSLVPLARQDWAAWLDEDPEAVRRLLRPMDPQQFHAAPDPLPPRPTSAARRGTDQAGQSGRALPARSDPDQPARYDGGQLSLIDPTPDP